MASGPTMVVTGIPETVDALNKVANMDMQKAETEAGRAILPTVKANTRHATGALQSSWAVEGGAFINTQDYAPFQEFGTVFVDPTFAVARAWDEKQSAVEQAFAKEIERVASQAGFDT